jgi:hypothetical protein
MIVNWKKQGMKVVPLAGNGPINNFTLLPGNNFVPDEVWDKLKEVCRDSIKANFLEEVAVKEESQKIKEPVKDDSGNTKKDKDGKPLYKEKEVKRKRSQNLGELPLEEAEKIIKDTYDLKTLNKFKDTGAESVRALVLKQIEAIETYGEDKSKKKVKR